MTATLTKESTGVTEPRGMKLSHFLLVLVAMLALTALIAHVALKKRAELERGDDALVSALRAAAIETPCTEAPAPCRRFGDFDVARTGGDA